MKPTALLLFNTPQRHRLPAIDTQEEAHIRLLGQATLQDRQEDNIEKIKEGKEEHESLNWSLECKNA